MILRKRREGNREEGRKRQHNRKHHKKMWTLRRQASVNSRNVFREFFIGTKYKKKRNI